MKINEELALKEVEKPIHKPPVKLPFKGLNKVSINKEEKAMAKFAQKKKKEEDNDYGDDFEVSFPFYF